MSKYTNHTDIPLGLAVWLAWDDYDKPEYPNTLSATTLLRPIRSLVLGERLETHGTVDLSDLIPSRLGTAVHTAVETAWKSNYKKCMRELGYPDKIINQVSINPSKPTQGIDIYLEKRETKFLDGYYITGKLDLLIDGQLHDVKTTKTFTWIKDSNAWEYAMQASIYRWLNPTLVTDENVIINYIFTDWSPLRAQADKNYPPKRVIPKSYPLQSLERTEQYIKTVIARLDELRDTPQEFLPRCTSSDLWQDPSRWAYYKDPNKTTRATKVFDLQSDAMLTYTNDGSRGLVVERPAEVKRCNYCPARPICTQAEELEQAGLLKL